MINVLVLEQPRAPWNYERVRLPVDAIAQRSATLEMRAIAASQMNAIRTPEGGIHEIIIPDYFDVLVLTQPVSWQIVDAIVWLRHHKPNLAIVVDVVSEPNNDIAAHRMRRAAAMADVVTCATPRLAEVYGYDIRRTHTIRDAVHPSMLEQPASATTRRRSAKHAELNADRTIGWTGDPMSHLHDLVSTQGALSKVVGERDGRSVTFRGICDPAGLATALSLREDDVEASGALEPRLRRVALSELDIGIVPVAMDGRSEDYSGLTAIELAASGVPVIASRTPEHVALRDNGMPMFLVNNRHREWVRALRTVLSYGDKELRNLAIAHRENVRKFHLIDHRVALWANAWRAGADISRLVMEK